MDGSQWEMQTRLHDSRWTDFSSNLHFCRRPVSTFSAHIRESELIGDTRKTNSKTTHDKMSLYYRRYWKRLIPSMLYWNKWIKALNELFLNGVQNYLIFGWVQLMWMKIQDCPYILRTVARIAHIFYIHTFQFTCEFLNTFNIPANWLERKSFKVP